MALSTPILGTTIIQTAVQVGRGGSWLCLCWRTVPAPAYCLSASALCLASHALLVVEAAGLTGTVTGTMPPLCSPPLSPIRPATLKLLPALQTASRSATLCLCRSWVWRWRRGRSLSTWGCSGAQVGGRRQRQQGRRRPLLPLVSSLPRRSVCCAKQGLPNSASLVYRQHRKSHSQRRTLGGPVTGPAVLLCLHASLHLTSLCFSASSPAHYHAGSFVCSLVFALLLS